jgi:hypothetical protein
MARRRGVKEILRKGHPKIIFAGLGKMTSREELKASDTVGLGERVPFASGADEFVGPG